MRDVAAAAPASELRRAAALRASAANQNQPSPAAQHAADTVRHDLSKSGSFLDHLLRRSSGDVADATHALEALPPDQRQQAVQDLASDGTMDKLAGAITSPSYLGFGSGLSADQKRDFFNSMAQDLDGKTLAQLSQSFSKTSQGDRADVTALGDTVATQRRADAGGHLGGGRDDPRLPGRTVARHPGLRPVRTSRVSGTTLGSSLRSTTVHLSHSPASRSLNPKSFRGQQGDWR